MSQAVIWHPSEFGLLQVARANIENAGLSHKIDVHVAPAVETLANIKEAESFDLCFIDADRDSRYLYWQEAKRLVRKGGIIVSYIYLYTSYTASHFCVPDR